MPFVRIDLIRGRRPEDIRAIADAAHQGILDVLQVPARDRFQVVTEHDSDHVIALDAGLGFDRTDQLVMIQIFTQSGRTTEVKQRLFRTIAGHLEALGIRGEDVFLSIIENGPQDWSFGFGRAQYIEGDLAVPGS
ncbi:tautomerase family protein [Streptomyces sp. SID13726]|uniref:tautomerase family protein n=1 Tax=Streptomyces sp. SID13726 TaxID=2706058 RepID=UPI0013BDFAFA|nr:tautomerase family protein [Streptomyces sp. SID13726]NEA99779.1 tautomerase family protein [Streptomyces sp. SID13726]